VQTSYSSFINISAMIHIWHTPRIYTLVELSVAARISRHGHPHGYSCGSTRIYIKRKWSQGEDIRMVVHALWPFTLIFIRIFEWKCVSNSSYGHFDKGWAFWLLLILSYLPKQITGMSNILCFPSAVLRLQLPRIGITIAPGNFLEFSPV